MQSKGGEASNPTLEERVGELRRIVDLLVGQMEGSFDVELDYGPGTASYLDAVIAQLRTTDRPLTPSLFLSMGGYLGEVLIEEYEGEWTELDGELAVRIDQDTHTATLRVFDWVKKAYQDPEGAPLADQMAWAIGNP